MRWIFTSLVFLLFLTGSVSQIDRVVVGGSRAIYPVSEMVAEELSTLSRHIQFHTTASDTEQGFQNFCSGMIDINGASRPITRSEQKICELNFIEYEEIPIALYSIVILKTDDNRFVKDLRMDEIRHIFQKQDPARYWNELRPEWPARKIHIVRPSPDSITSDFFRQYVFPENEEIRDDGIIESDDRSFFNSLRHTSGGVGFIHMSSMMREIPGIAPVAVYHPDLSRSVTPGMRSIHTGEYSLLSRPLYLYINRMALIRPAVRSYIVHYLQNAGRILSLTTTQIPMETGYYRKIEEHIFTASSKPFSSETNLKEPFQHLQHYRNWTVP